MYKLYLSGLRICLLAVSLWCSQGLLFAQTPALEFNVNSAPGTKGPTIANQVARFENNLDNPVGGGFAVYNPALTATLSLTQRFTYGGRYGLTFGEKTDGSPFPTFVRMDLGVPGQVSGENFTSIPPANSGGIASNVNYGFNLVASGRALQNAGLPTNARHRMGTLTITFNRPVSNPVLQVENMGGFFTYSSGARLSYSMEFNLLTPGVSLVKLDGNNAFQVNPTQILNSDTTPDATDAGSANGSVLVAGLNLLSISLDVYMDGNGLGPAWAAPSGVGYHANEGIVLGLSIPTPVQISGNIFNDVNALADNTVNGTGIGSASGKQLYMNLFTNTGVFMTSVPVQANGSYLFPEVPPHMNYITLLNTTAGSPTSSPPAGWALTGENIGTAPGSDGIVDGQLHFPVGTVNVTNVNMGIRQLVGSMSGYVFADKAKDGTADDPLADVVLELRDASGNPILDGGGTPVTTTTGTDGSYAFTNIPPGTYTIVEQQPAGFVSKSDTEGNPLDNIIGSVVVNAGQDTPNNNFEENMNPLPVTLISFTAKTERENVVLTWSTASEINNKEFQIEYGVDGARFEVLATKDGAGNANTRLDYRFTHEGAGRLGRKVLYYRLVQVDLDGTRTLSRITAVHFRELTDLKIFPLPAPKGARVTVTGKELGSYEIFDLVGRSVSRHLTTQTEPTILIDTSNLTSGIYILRFSNGAKAKLVIQ